MIYIKIMENDKPNINEELDHIRNSINKKDNKPSNDDNFIVLDKIISKGKNYDNKSARKGEPRREYDKKTNNNLKQKEKIKTVDKPNNLKKNNTNKISNTIKKTKDPVAELVDREIKPIIKKWIAKNLKSFVKTIVMQEMKLISKATQKHK